MAKRILITVSKDAMRRNILETGFMDVIATNSSTEVILVVDKDKVDDYEKQFGSNRVKIVGYSRFPERGVALILAFLIRTGINSHSLRTYRNRAFARGKTSLFSHLLKGFISNTLGRSSLFSRFLRYVYIKLKSPQLVYDIFDEHKPDLVLSLSGINRDFDGEFCRVAKQRKILLLGMVRSWDNLNNHGVLPVVPDVWYFQNEFLKEMATNLQGIDLSKIKTRQVGLPHYDSYHCAKDYVMDKSDFMHKYGFDSNKKLIMLGGSDFYYSEDKLTALLNEAIEAGKIHQPVQILFRPHPSSLFSIEDYGLDSLKHIILNDAFSGETKFTDTDFFTNLLYHSDIIINIASTLSIDAAVFDKPAVCVNFDDLERDLSHYESVNRLYDHFDHYERLVATGGVRVSESIDDLINDVNDYLADPNLDKDGRKKIIETFVAPFDGQSSRRLGKFVAEEIATLA